ncbi:hypothetical protein ACHAWF_009528 [Thalassiosira exigua]
MKPCTILLPLALTAVQAARDLLPSKGRPPLFQRHRHQGRLSGLIPDARGVQVLRAGEQIETQTRHVPTNKAVAIGMIFALNSGMVNGVCLSGLLSPTKQASAAVTGAWTNSALGAAMGNSDQFAFNGKCILSYCFGSLISGIVNPNPKVFEVSVSSIRAALWIGCGLLYASSAMTQKSRDFIFLALMANGITNSLTSTTTANLVRSAHFSGITSDIGTFLGQVLRGNEQNLMKLKVFSSLAVAFWTGGYASYSLTEKFGSRILLFSSMLYLMLGFAVAYV